MEAIVTELDDITDVVRLGLYLGVRMSALEKIETEYPSLKLQKKEIIYRWLKREDIIQQKQAERPTWDKLTDAVAKLDLSSSKKIRHKHRHRLNSTLGERIYCKHC